MKILENSWYFFFLSLRNYLYLIYTVCKVFYLHKIRVAFSFVKPTPVLLYGLNKPNTTEKIIILFFNTMWGQPLFSPSLKLPNNFEITTDKQRISDASVVVFYLPTLGLMNRIAKLPGQIWVSCTMESEGLYPYFRDPKFMKHFDLIMGYRTDYDVYTSYLDPEHYQDFKELPELQPKTNLVAYFASSYYELSKRTQYVTQLMQYIEIHSYGKVLNNKKLLVDKRKETKNEIITHYKFTLSIENALVKDYVTEKFFAPLFVGSVPIYLGAPNIEDFAPGEHCFIDIRDFDSPKSLAKYLLYLEQNDTAYEEYFDWRNKPRRKSFLDLVESQKVNPIIRLCEKIQEKLSNV
ncbi:alpha-1,3-fucosyltransferase [Aphanothece hegewaldii CCALA 016]|uniref:Alpha-1,3-fucosyltransferase n=1 Tax=Aphanothece hegewaldii CCALA 016 TaxID=2107694 RepID=A0A2T1LWR7_9CHRO|nr:glycosyltransferase family 10 [Aphanothece hegewaldii]PSF36241.1 alpha-1,3-fucosyltransferase [Aphanothece hegewaldii CCALA 016]